MTVVVVSTVVDAPSAAVWRRMADFAGWHTWLPRITATTMDPGHEAAQVGAVRTLLLADGDTVRERLLSMDERARTFSYEFAGPHRFPVRRYVGRVRVEDVTTSGATYVHWSGDFDTDAGSQAKAAGVFTSIYTAFLAALADDLSTSSGA